MRDDTKFHITNYLRTPNGTACSDCGVLGKHYLIDDQPYLYWLDGQWFCLKCLSVRRKIV